VEHEQVLSRIREVCLALPETNERLSHGASTFFVRGPPHVGHRGWLGVRLDRRIYWDELTGITEDAFAEVAPPKLVESARATR
jgi:hypothetical protein